MASFSSRYPMQSCARRSRPQLNLLPLHSPPAVQERTAGAIFGDADEDFSSLARIKARLEAWKVSFPASYRDAYVSLSAPQIFSPLGAPRKCSAMPCECSAMPCECSAMPRKCSTHDRTLLCFGHA